MTSQNSFNVNLPNTNGNQKHLLNFGEVPSLNPSKPSALLDFGAGFGNPDPFNRLKNRLNSSPLKVPLDTAITKVAANISRTSPSRSPSSSRLSHHQLPYQNYSDPLSFQTDDQQILDHLHPQALEFLQSHFSGLSTKSIPIPDFINKLLQEFSNLWSDPQAQAVLPEFVEKLAGRLGGDLVELCRLEGLARENGIIGLILGVFKELKSEGESSRISEYSSCKPPQYPYQQSSLVSCSSTACSPQLTNLKNILQEFTQSLLKTTQNEIYSKLNTHTRKLVLKYNDAEALLKDINERINEGIDKISYGVKKEKLEKGWGEKVRNLEERINELEAEVERERVRRERAEEQKNRLEEDRKRLGEQVEKLQDYVMRGQEKSPAGRAVLIPGIQNKGEEKSRIISTKVGPPVQAAFGKLIPIATLTPLSSLRQTTLPNSNSSNLLYVSKVQNNKENNPNLNPSPLLNTATIVHRTVTPTKHRVVQVSPSKGRR